MTEVIGSCEPVKGVVGEDVILPCHLEPPSDVRFLTVEWKHNEDIVHRYRSKKDYFRDQHQQFINRTSLFLDELVHGNISLKLTNVTKNDAGDYTCYVPKLDSQVKKGNLSLEVVQWPTGDRSSNPGGSQGDDKGPLIGGITGGVLVVGLLVLGAVLFWKCRRVRNFFSTLIQRRPQRDSNANATEETRPSAMPLMDNPRGDTDTQDHHQRPQENPQQLNGGAELEHLKEHEEEHEV